MTVLGGGWRLAIGMAGIAAGATREASVWAPLAGSATAVGSGTVTPVCMHICISGSQRPPGKHCGSEAKEGALQPNPDVIAKIEIRFSFLIM